MRSIGKYIVFTLLLVLMLFNRGKAQPVFNWVETNADTVTKYARFEVRTDITGDFSNPYDWNQVAVYCHFYAPDGTDQVVDGFFYQDYEMTQPDVLVPVGDPYFVVRFAPDEPGAWTFDLVCLDISSFAAYPTQSFYVEDSPDPGFISISSDDKLVFDNGDPFFGVGTNLAWATWDNGFTDYLEWLDELSDNGANFMKLTMAPWWLELEWSGTELGNYSERQKRAWVLDTIFSKLEEKGMYCQLNFLIHDELRTDVTPGWGQNPYNASNGGPCGEVQDFMTNSEARNYFKRKIRYILARWGYSPHLESWEILSEADMTTPWGSFTTQTVDWINDMAEYTALLDLYNRPVSTGFAIPQHHPGVWNDNAITFTQQHIYDFIPDLEIKIYSFSRWYLDQYQKPTLVGEFALAHNPDEIIQYDPNGIAFHNCLWSSVFSGSLGTAMSWWWNNYLIPQGLFQHFQPISNFLDEAGVPSGDLQPEMLLTTADNNDEIYVFPDYYNSNESAPENYFTFDPSGFISPPELYLGKILYGYFFNSSRNPPTFKVNSTKPGEFSIITGGTAVMSTVRISLDGNVMLQQGASTHSTYTINLPVGEHEIKVENVGNGYLNVDKYRFLNYSPRLRAFSMRNDLRAMGWIQNKKYNWEYFHNNGTPPAVTGGKIYFTGFETGKYHLDWYDHSGEFTATEILLNVGDTIIADASEIVWDGAFDLHFVSPVSAGFTADVTTGDAPLTVQFTDQSFIGGAAIDSWLWNFGDGTFSTQQNPAHIFTTPGVYDVSLKLTSGGYADSITKENYITVLQPLVADFTADDTTVAVGEIIYFSDLSLGNPTSWYWDFGDNISSSLQNPAHFYTQPGFYSVSLLIQDENRSDYIIKEDYIEVYVPLVADFEVDTTVCPTGGSIQFTDLSQGDPDTWFWDFGDGETDNTQNPTHTFSLPGIYSVLLKVTASWRADSILKENLITVVDPLVAAFEADNTSVYTGTEVHFTDLSQGDPDTWFWNFGDGDTSYIQNPSHAYQQEGVYTVKLKVGNSYFEDSLEKTDYITVIEELIADFAADTTNVLIGQEVHFTDLSSGNPDFWIWDFGDTTNGINPNPAHKYWYPGFYSVTLQIKRGDSTDMVTKENYIHVFEPIVAGFHAFPLLVQTGEPVQFIDDSGGNPFFWDWDFGDGASSILENPEHAYDEEGYFTVEMKVSNYYFSDSIVKQDYIRVYDPLVADFTADTTKVLKGQKVQFMDVSAGNPDFWVWDFGDTTNGVSQNPEHYYWNTGSYTVSLQIYKGDSTDMVVKDNFIEVRDSLIADFYAEPLEVRVNDTVRFYDISTGNPTEWLWKFGELGDEKVSSQNPVYCYHFPGIYTVELIVANAFDTDTLAKEDYITVLPPLITQTIVFPAGWSSMSVYINPLNPAVETILEPVNDNLVFSYNNQGIYWPAQNINTINDWNPYDGLILKLDQECELVIPAEDQLDKTVEISQGWGVLPVISPCSQTTQQLFVQLGDTLVLVKEIAGNKIFWPQAGINTLEELEPGRCYYIFATFQTEYSFSDCEQ